MKYKIGDKVQIWVWSHYEPGIIDSVDDGDPITPYHVITDRGFPWWANIHQIKPVIKLSNGADKIFRKILDEI